MCKCFNHDISLILLSDKVTKKKIECFRKNITVNNKYLLKKCDGCGLLNLSRHLTFSFFFETILLLIQAKWYPLTFASITELRKV